jgi:hypothetical protein
MHIIHNAHPRLRMHAVSVHVTTARRPQPCVLGPTCVLPSAAPGPMAATTTTTLVATLDDVLATGPAFEAVCIHLCSGPRGPDAHDPPGGGLGTCRHAIHNAHPRMRMRACQVARVFGIFWVVITLELKNPNTKTLNLAHDLPGGAGAEGGGQQQASSSGGGGLNALRVVTNP